jgi:hypothetical protein
VGHCGLKYPNAGDCIFPRVSGPASGRFQEFRRLWGRLPHKTGGLAGMCQVIFEIAVKLFKVLSSHRSSIKKHFEPSTVKIGGTVHKI